MTSTTTAHTVLDPSTEEVITTVEATSVEGTDEAIAKADKAFQSWRHVSPADRGRLLRQIGRAHV